MKPLTDTEIKSLLLNTLKEIDAFCTTNNMTYYLAYGTLLGAVRHRGFIPWDDDIDICMPRPDYEKFISSFESKDSRYQIISHLKDKNYPYFFAKVHDTKTILEINTTYKNRMGLYVDIFPIDAVPSDIKLQKKYIRKFNLYRKIYNIKAIRINRHRTFLKNLLILLSRLVTSFIPFSFLPYKIDKISKTYNYNEHSIVSIAATSDHRLLLDKKLFAEGIKLRFEDMYACAPKSYSEVLSENYGDYLKLPPIEKQTSHHKLKAFYTSKKHALSGAKILLFLVLILLSGCLVDIPNTRPEGSSTIVYGSVFNKDTNSPVISAVISDGFTTTSTDKLGKYRLKTYPGASHVFISVPELYEIPMNDGMPQIFQSIDNMKDSILVNFNLKPLADGVENEFTLIAVGDPQVRNANHLRRLHNETIPDIKTTLLDYNNVYGLTLGDLAFDNLNLFNDLKQSFIDTNIPFFHTIGNHDFSAVVYDPLEASKEFVSHFGPLDYSLNRGNAHIVVMNNVFNYGVSTYNLGFSEEQINWLKSDLEHVPKDKMLIVSVHIPVLPAASMERKSQFLETISSFNEIHILSGHWHANRNIIDNGLNVYEHLTGAASGLWWSGVVNKCGAPNGYGVYEISGNKMKNWYYKSVNHDKDHQIRMLGPNTFGDNEGYIIANVWNADENWKIELFEDGINRGQMEQFTDYAPEVFSYIKSQNIAEGTNWYQKTNHLYRMKPNNKDATILIKATDSFGNIYEQDTPLKGFSSLSKY